MIVVDSNVIASAVVTTTHTPAVAALRTRDRRWAAPTLWRSEVQNVLVTVARSGLLTAAQALLAWDVAVRLVGRHQSTPDGARVLALAMERGITAYDATFVATAQALRTVLVTADQPLLRACPDVAVDIGEFIAAR